MYLVETKNDDVKCKDANEIKERFFKSDVVKIYSLSEVAYDDLIATSDIRDSIYNYLKGEQKSKKDVIEYVSAILDVKKTEVSKVIASMKKEKIIYVVVDDGWLGID